MNGGRILHLSLGAFARAHQSVFIQRLIDAGDDAWHIAAGNLRPENPDMAALLQAVGHRYTVESVTPDGARACQRIDAICRCGCRVDLGPDDHELFDWHPSCPNAMVADGRQRARRNGQLCEAAELHHADDP